MIRYFAALAILTATGSSMAATPKPINDFRKETTSQILSCQAIERAVIKRKSLLEEEIVEAIEGCISEGKIGAKKFFPPALASLAKKKGAATLLKDYYAAWITAVNGIMPAVNERAVDYAQRQTALETKYNEIWNRFEIEAEL